MRVLVSLGLFERECLLALSAALAAVAAGVFVCFFVWVQRKNCPR